MLIPKPNKWTFSVMCFTISTNHRCLFSKWCLYYIYCSLSRKLTSSGCWKLQADEEKEDGEDEFPPHFDFWVQFLAGLIFALKSRDSFSMFMWRGPLQFQGSWSLCLILKSCGLGTFYDGRSSFRARSFAALPCSSIGSLRFFAAQLQSFWVANLKKCLGKQKSHFQPFDFHLFTCSENRKTQMKLLRCILWRKK